MKLKAFALLSLILMMLITLIYSEVKFEVKADPRTIIVPDDYPTIQGAIDVANDGDIVKVKTGYYAEGQINIGKRITLLAEGSVIVDGLQAGHVFCISSSNVTIQGFTIINASSNSLTNSGIYVGGKESIKIIDNKICYALNGIRLYSSKNCLIAHNYIENCSYGIYLEFSSQNNISENHLKNCGQGGIFFYESSKNYIYDNEIATYGYNCISLYKDCSENIIVSNNITLSKSGSGVYVYRSTKNDIIQNNITENSVGVYLLSSSANNIRENIVSDSMWIFESSSNYIADNDIIGCVDLYKSGSNELHGNSMNEFKIVFDGLEHFLNYVDESNMVNGKPICYWIDTKDRHVPVNAGLVILVKCINVTVENLNFSETGIGVLLFQTSDSKIINCNFIGIHPYSVNSAIYLIESTNNTIKNNCLSENWCVDVIRLKNSRENYIINNTLEGNTYNNIVLVSSPNNTIADNRISSGSADSLGIRVYQSDYNKIFRNYVYGVQGPGLVLDQSCYNLLRNNTLNAYGGFGVLGINIKHFYQDIDISNTVHGKPLYYLINKTNGMINDASYVGLIGCSNIQVCGGCMEYNIQGILLVCTNNSLITENTISNNNYGIQIINSWNNTIYLNEFCCNDKNVITDEKSVNKWNGPYFIGGNYWKGYVCADIYKGQFQNETGSDGIGDIPYIIDGNNVDQYPLMGPFHEYDTGAGYKVNVISNSTINDFKYFESNTTIRIVVYGISQTRGFCKLSIPNDLIKPPFFITVNGEPVDYEIIFENETLSILYFTYSHSTSVIIIVPEYSTITILFASALITPIIVSLKMKCRRKRT